MAGTYALVVAAGRGTRFGGDLPKQYLALAGRSDTLFSDDATSLIAQVSRGLPRQVNNLATGSLICDAVYTCINGVCSAPAPQ